MSRISRIAAQKLRPKIVEEMQWSDLRTAINDGTAAQKDAMLNCAKRGDSESLGKWVSQLFAKAVDVKVQTEIDLLLADNALTEAEITRIFE